jgi:hypothetical protein
MLFIYSVTVTFPLLCRQSWNQNPETEEEELCVSILQETRINNMTKCGIVAFNKQALCSC